MKADVEYLDPKKVVSGVFEVYLNVHNPFNTNNIDESITIVERLIYGRL